MVRYRDEGPRLRRLVWSLGLGVFGLWMILGFGPRFLLPQQLRASFSDMFEGINALFSGLAFAGLICAILLQREELRLQRKELEATRAELAGQREQLTVQNETLRKQAFENTFFQMLRLHNEIVSGIEVQDAIGGRIEGRESFKRLHEILGKIMAAGTPEGQNKEVAERLNRVYLRFFGEYEGVVGHYFRNLYQIVKFVKNSDIVDKRFYTNIIRAQLSAYELVLLFYNGVSQLGRDKFKPLVEEFGLLKTLRSALLFDPSHRELFREEAYRGSSGIS